MPIRVSSEMLLESLAGVQCADFPLDPSYRMCDLEDSVGLVPAGAKVAVSCSILLWVLRLFGQDGLIGFVCFADLPRQPSSVLTLPRARGLSLYEKDSI